MGHALEDPVFELVEVSGYPTVELLATLENDQREDTAGLFYVWPRSILGLTVRGQEVRRRADYSGELRDLVLGVIKR